MIFLVNFFFYILPLNLFLWDQGKLVALGSKTAASAIWLIRTASWSQGSATDKHYVLSKKKIEDHHLLSYLHRQNDPSSNSNKSLDYYRPRWAWNVWMVILTHFSYINLKFSRFNKLWKSWKFEGHFHPVNIVAINFNFLPFKWHVVGSLSLYIF